jgi:Leucine-rich repeat (LRR) protein
MDTPAPKPTKRKRPWLRFSLRTFFLVVTALCIWIGIRVNAARHQREAIAAILKAGGSVTFDYQLIAGSGRPGTSATSPAANPPGPVWLRDLIGEEFFRTAVAVTFDYRAHQRSLTTSELAELSKLPALRTLSAVNSPFSRVRQSKSAAGGESASAWSSLSRALSFGLTETLIDTTGMKQIGRLTNLRELTLDNNQITDVGLSHVKSLTQLETLNLNNTEITGTGLQSLNSEFLGSLELQNTDVDDLGLLKIGEFANLKTLKLDGTLVTDFGLESLCRLTNLETLSLSKTEVSSSGLTHLNSTRLKTLLLNETRVDDNALDRIGSIASLESLQLNSTQVTDAGISRIQNLTGLVDLSLVGTDITDAATNCLCRLTKLRTVNLDGTRVTFVGIARLQKALPLASIVATTAPAPQDLRRVVPDQAVAVSRLTERERVDAAPAHDESGARWMIRLAPTSRKKSLLGRPSSFEQNGYWTPFKDYILRRNPATGDVIPFRPIRLPSAAAQVLGGASGTVCALTAADAQSAGDILFLDDRFEMGIPSVGGQIRLTGHSETPWRLLLSPPNRFGQTLVSCSDDGSIRLWNLDDNRLAMQRAVPSSGAPALIAGQEIARFPCYGRDESGDAKRGELAAFSPNGQWLVTAYQRTVTFRSPANGAEEFVWNIDLTPSEQILVIRFDRSGNNLFAFLDDAADTYASSLKFLQFDISKRQESRYAGIHGVVDGRATADGKSVITWDGSPKVTFWDQAQRKETATLRVANTRVYDVAFSPTGDVMATAGDDGEVKFWCVADQRRMEAARPIVHEGVDLIGFAIDGRGIVTASDDGWLKFWDAPEFCWEQPQRQPPRMQEEGSDKDLDAGTSPRLD